MKFYIINLVLSITCLPSFLFSQLPYPNKLDTGAGSFGKFYALNINHDTIIDVVYNRSLSSGINGFYMGLGYYKDGHLAFNSFKLSNEYMPNIIIMDYNHDGVDDVLATCRSNENFNPRLWMSDGNMLVSSILDSGIFADTCFQTVNVLDINGDGFDDFYIPKKIGGNVNLLELYLANPIDIGSYTLTYNIEANNIIQAIDVNNDGYIDFIGNEFDPKKLFLWFYDIGTNKYKKQPIISDFTGSKSITFVGDIDYDGVMDIVIDDSNTDSLYLLSKFMEDSIQTITPLISIIYGGYFWKDINLDGFIDFTINGTKNFLNDGSGNLTLSNIKLAPSGESIYQKYDPINKTGFDLMQNGSAWQYIDGVWLNDLATTSEYKLQSVDDVEVLDLDQDGNTDFVMATRWGAAIIAYYRDAYGHYTKKEKLADTEGAHDVSFSDLNQDGIIDMVYSGIWSGDLNIKYGIEPGVFSERVNILKSYGLVRGSAIGDFSNDSFPDIIVSSITSGQILLFDNIDGLIQPMKVIHDNNDGPTSLIIEDYNEDGYMDIIYTSGGSYKVLENDKNGGWLTAKKLFENNAKEFIRADFDGDRKKEWVVSNWQEVFIYKIENGVPTIWRTIDVEDVSYRTDFYVMDYDGDGYKDIIYLVGGNPKARLYKNNDNQNWVYDDLFENKMAYKLPTFKEESFNLDIDNDYDMDLGYVFNDELFLIQDRINDPGLTGVTFWDKNLDSIYQSSEDIKLTGVGVIAENENNTISRFSNNGIYMHYLPRDTFNVSGIPLSECWIGQQSSVRLDLTNPDSLVRQDFGFELQDGINEEIKVSMARSTLRCLLPIQHFITIKNNTCFPIVGSFNHIQDSRMDNPYLISLDYAEYEKPVISLPNLTLQPGEVLKYSFISKAPDESNVDSFITDTLRIYYKDPMDDNISVMKDFVFPERLRCAIDPNDKLVQPDRSNEFGKSYITNESMYYTIRFQNTGNDTAFNIKLIDTLSPYLDLTTFDPIDASHTYEVSLDIKERILKVDFRNILLPDSTTNLPGSNGFFTFGIRPHAGLKDDDKVENNAAIYFDFNKPIFTNTVQNVFIKDLQSLYVNTKEIDGSNTFSVYPNPVNDVVYIHSNYHDNRMNHVQLFDIMGREILKQNLIVNETTILDMSTFMPGCYILHISSLDDKTRYLSTKIIKSN